jgi:LmbE family N-acetylglucosaminyl deacetylase
VIRTMLTGLAGTVLLACGSAQQPGRQQGDTTSMRGQPMMDMMAARMMDSADARLDRLVGTMNQATGNRKVEAMAAVINEMVAHRRAMRTHARQMMRGPHGMMQNGMGGGAAPSPAKPDTADDAQNNQP